MRDLPGIHKQSRIIFNHAGLADPNMAARGVEGLNQQLASDLQNGGETEAREREKSEGGKEREKM
jgi:hypothetical protein